jgi:hypothetical protein
MLNVALDLDHLEVVDNLKSFEKSLKRFVENYCSFSDQRTLEELAIVPDKLAHPQKSSCTSNFADARKQTSLISCDSESPRPQH